MAEQKCPKCGEMVEAVDLDRPADCYYCDCGESWSDSDGWYDRRASHSDMLRKAQKEGR